MDDYVLLLFVAFPNSSASVRLLHRSTRGGCKEAFADTPNKIVHNYPDDPVEGWITIQPYSEFKTYGLEAM